MPLKQRLGLQNDPIFLLDGSAFIYRGFFANKNLRRSDGFPTNALVVVTRVLLRILREEKPRYLLFVQDGKGKNFRHEIYPLYKANRDAMPEELVKQIEPIQRMIRALGIKLEISQGCEADDCIASLAARFSVQHPVVIVSGDKDLKQCLGPNVVMWDPAAKEEKLLTEAQFVEESGISPAQWPDMQAIIGDTSDNIPGVPGIGPTTAGKIFSVCSSLEDIQSRLSELPPKIQDKLRDHMDKTFIWRKLTTLSQNVCKSLTLNDMIVQPLDATQCRALSDEFEMVALRREISDILQKRAHTPPPPPLPMPPAATAKKTSPHAQQISLFTPAQTDAPVPEVRDVSALPNCTGHNAAIVWTYEGALGKQAPPYLAVANTDMPDVLWTGDTDALRPWLARAHCVITADIKRLIAADLCAKTLPTGGATYFDLSIAAYLINPEESDYSWPRLAARFGAVPASVKGPAALALAMAATYEERLKKDALFDLYTTVELPLTPVLTSMEAQGIAVDPAAFQTFLMEVQDKISKLTEKIYALAGTTFNLRSAQQTGEVLFTTLNLAKPRKTKGGQASTSQQTLEKLAGSHAIVDNILQFRKLEKMRSTYLAPLPQIMDSNNRLHTTFNQKSTATGRLSSSNPNLQNIPVRGPMGKRMRACFIAAQGNALVSADYSQIELRVLAHISGDKTLLGAFRQNEDIHTRTAALIYDLPPDEISSDQRRNAKTINFGLIYGMGAHKLAQELKISSNKAKEFIDRYFSRLTGLKTFYDNVEEEAKKNGFVITLGGRRRLLPDIHSNNGQAYALARRQAINTVIQGSAADIIKLAMLAVANDKELQRMKASLILQVHDELLLEAPQNIAEDVGARTANLMANVAPGGVRLAVPLLVDWGAGKNWAEAH